MKISVVIPAYNAAHFLPRCLESVFAQTLSPAEVIVVDDGSKDDTAATATKLGATVVSRPNGGLSAARNTGVQHATGEWIGLLDADDRWSPDKLRAQADCVQAGTVLVYTGIQIFSDDGVRQSCPAVDPVKAVKMLRYANPITPSSVLARRDALLQTGGFREDVRACEDWDMWVRLSRLGSFSAVTEPLTGYYVYPSSMSTDPQRMLTAMEQILPSTLVSDLSGFERWAWTRRIRAVQLYSAAVIARENGRDGEMSYMLRSLAAWPSPLWEPHRFIGAAVSARNQLRKPHDSRHATS
ncbi:MAG TPA: glycosyltransferase [Acidobacteriaceae bacterium]|nr:glycosyltransferase [Acidobacteriaceae bacterium]